MCISTSGCWRIAAFLVVFPFANTSKAEDSSAIDSQTALILVTGAPGKDEYAEQFQAWADRWRDLAATKQWTLRRISDESANETISTMSPRDELQAAIKELGQVEQLWLVLIGHGTYAREKADFNLVGPDVSANELAEWLKPVSAQLISINCFSCSAPFMKSLSGENRVIVTSTKSSGEYNFSRFGGFLSQCINDPALDLDHDADVSLFEAFLAASKQTAQFYSDESRLASEHALLDDNGDGAGTTADFYRGVRPIKESMEGELDGRSAGRILLRSSYENSGFSPALAARRRQIEQEIDRLRRQKSLLERDTYYASLESLLLELAEVYRLADQN